MLADLLDGQREKRKKKDTTLSCLSLVREAGVEPARPCEHWHLKPASLPIPPLARGVCAVLFSASSILPQSFTSVNIFFAKKSFFRKKNVCTEKRIKLGEHGDGLDRAGRGMIKLVKQ